MDVTGIWALGRVRHLSMRDEIGRELPGVIRETVIMSEPRALCEAACLEPGVALVAMPDVVAALEAGQHIRLLRRWYADAGSVSLYYASRTLLPARTRAFVDSIVRV